MIKRRFYKDDHGDQSASSSSSSDSDSDPVSEEEEVEVEEAEEQEEETGKQEEQDNEDYEDDDVDGGSGYQSEDSSANVVDGASSGLVAEDDELSLEGCEPNHEGNPPVNRASVEESGNAGALDSAANSDDPVDADFASSVLKCKSVFKCRLCPRIICLNEEMIRRHLKSKRHYRSKKLLGEGRLKLMLNSDGEIEEEAETHAERHARTIALAQQPVKFKRDTGRQRQSKRKKRLQNRPKNKEHPKESSKKRRRKTKD